MGLGFKLINFAWNNNFTPQQVLRFMGPRGPRAVKNIVKQRFNDRWNEADTSIISDYLYHVTCADASGELSLNALLKVAVFPPHPQKHLSKRSGLYARIPLFDSLKEGKINCKTLIQFGDNDWMFHPDVTELSESANGKVKLEFLPLAGHHLYLDNSPAFHKSVNSFCRE